MSVRFILTRYETVGAEGATYQQFKTTEDVAVVEELLTHRRPWIVIGAESDQATATERALASGLFSSTEARA